MTRLKFEKPTAPATKLDQLVALLSTESGVTMDEMCAATGWLPHSVRGALAGALRKKGHTIESAKADGVRRWRIVPKVADQ